MPDAVACRNCPNPVKAPGRLFCSRSCNGQYQGRRVDHTVSQAKAAAANVAKAQQRDRLYAACAFHMDAAGKVPVWTMVQVLAVELRRERNLATGRRYLKRNGG